MENQTNSPKQTALAYGLILGFISILISVSTYAMGTYLEQDWKTNVLGIIVMIVVIVLGIKQHKKANDGLLSLSQALKTGVGIALIGAVISIIYTVIFAKFIEPGFIDQIVELQGKKMLESNPNITDDQIEMIATGTRKYFYVATTGMILIANLFMGFVFSLIAGLIMKRVPEQDY